jgi:hypothetical protein
VTMSASTTCVATISGTALSIFLRIV